MLWRLVHTRPDGSTISKVDFQTNQGHARQRLHLYWEHWAAEDPENRAIYHYTKQWMVLYQRPKDCACQACTVWSKEWGEHWSKWGNIAPHTADRLKLLRLDAPVPRSSKAKYRVIDRQCDARRIIDDRRAPTVHSQHPNKSEAQKGLVEAVRQWRRSSYHKTAVRTPGDRYVLMMSSSPVAVLMIEAVPS